jgi:hypothetical protein
MSKKNYNFGQRCQCYKTFFSVIHAIIGVFPHDFDPGHADSSLITSKKVL